MKYSFDSNNLDCGVQELTIDEVNSVSGASVKDAGAALGLMATIGGAAFGSGWGAVAVGGALAGAPIAVAAMAGLAVYAGYVLLQK
jgi:hypothetical protein